MTDRPSLFLIIHTHDCGAPERVIHGVLSLRQRKTAGGDEEWFLTTRDEVLEIYRSTKSPQHPTPHLTDVRQGRVSGTRELVAHPDCIMVYRVLGDCIEITNVLHARQKYP